MLREARLNTQLSQEVLAELAGLHRNTVSRIERGVYNPTLETLFALAGALGKLPDELIKETRERTGR
ncbi:MAG: helix-turn-helix transcriptional regulator [Betaproteobacteria bacterium]